MNTSIVIALISFAHMIRAERTEAQLYNSVVSADYNDAVSIAKELQETNPVVLQQTLNHLQLNNIRNIVDFSYQLWNSNGKDIVKDNFPPQYSMLFNDGALKITDRESGPAVQLAAPSRDAAPEITQLDDINSPRSSWKFISIWDDSRLYFKIWNTETNQYLKFDNSTDGKHTLTGSENANTNAFHWYLVPKKDDPTSELSFQVFNRQNGVPIEFPSNDIYGAVPFRKTSRLHNKNKKSHSSWNLEPQ